MCLFLKEFININLLSVKRYGVNPLVLCPIVIWFWNWGQIQAIGRCYRWFLGRCDRLFNGLSMSADHHLWLHHWSNTPLGSEATISSGEDEGGSRKKYKNQENSIFCSSYLYLAHERPTLYVGCISLKWASVSPVSVQWDSPASTNPCACIEKDNSFSWIIL